MQKKENKIENTFYQEKENTIYNKDSYKLKKEIKHEEQSYKSQNKKNMKNYYSKNQLPITEIKKNIYVFSAIEGQENQIIEEIKIWKEKYNIILIDIEDEMKNYFNILLDELNKIIFLTEANILQIRKSKIYLREFQNKYKIENEKINMVFHKITQQTLSINVLKNTLKNYNFLGKINENTIIIITPYM